VQRRPDPAALAARQDVEGAQELLAHRDGSGGYAVGFGHVDLHLRIRERLDPYRADLVVRKRVALRRVDVREGVHRSRALDREQRLGLVGARGANLD
jgi:hypothetical protein